MQLVPHIRTATTLSARVKAKKVEWRNDRDSEGDAGMVVAVDPATWDDSFEIELGWLAARQTQGYRYLQAQEDGSVIHYSGGKPVVEATEDDFDEDDEA